MILQSELAGDLPRVTGDRVQVQCEDDIAATQRQATFGSCAGPGRGSFPGLLPRWSYIVSDPMDILLRMIRDLPGSIEYLRHHAG